MSLSNTKGANNRQIKKGVVKGYSVNTYHGLKKNHNEDRVTIVMNIKNPKN